MRQVSRCISCGNLVGQYKSYKAHMREMIKVFLTGEMKEVEYLGRVCKNCLGVAGYIIKKKKEKEEHGQ